jgi:hypothetical protein
MELGRFGLLGVGDGWSGEDSRGEENVFHVWSLLLEFLFETYAMCPAPFGPDRRQAITKDTLPAWPNSPIRNAASRDAGHMPLTNARVI